jgi:Bacterial membrane protein YfhO
VPGALPRYYTVGHSIPATSDDQTVGMFHSTGFDFRKSVLLLNQPESGPLAGDEHESAVQVIEQTPTRILLRTNRPTPGWLVALQTYYPGWTATVNNHESELVRANLAFTAVAVPAGPADVTLEYRPQSVRVGLLISGFTTGLIAVLALLAFLGGLFHSKKDAPAPSGSH